MILVSILVTAAEPANGSEGVPTGRFLAESTHGRPEYRDAPGGTPTGTHRRHPTRTRCTLIRSASSSSPSTVASAEGPPQSWHVGCCCTVMRKLQAHLGTVVLATWFLSLTPTPSSACSQDAGVWLPAADVEPIPARIPANGSVPLTLRCDSHCPKDPKQVLVSVRTASGGPVAGDISVLHGPIVVFTPSAELTPGARYEVELAGGSRLPFEVDAAVSPLQLSTLTASVQLGTPFFIGVPESYTCCDRDSCSASCYSARQRETVPVTARVDFGPLSGLKSQFEVSSIATQGTPRSSCVGCASLEHQFNEALPSYCTEVSVRWLADTTLHKLGRFCSSSGVAALAERETPLAERPAACRGPSQPSDAGRDARDIMDAGTALLDAEADAAADVALDAGAPTEQRQPAPVPESATSTPETSDAGCSAARGTSGRSTPWFSSALLLGLAFLRRRPRVQS